MKPLFGSEPRAAASPLTSAHDPFVTSPSPTALDAGTVVLPVAAVGTASLPATQTPRRSLPVVNEDEIARLGEQATSGLSQLPSKIMGSVRAADADAFGAELNQLVVVAKGLDPKSMQGKGLVSRALSFMTSTKERLLSQYNSVEKQMDALVVELEKKAEHHRARVGDLEQLYTANVTYHQSLEQAATHGEQLAAQLREAIAQYGAPSDAFDAQRVAEAQRAAERIEKRVDDLKRAMLLAKQTAPQIRLMQDNARALVQKFGDVKTVTLPAWKNTFTLYIAQLEQKKAVELINAVDDATDAALRQGADMLRENTEAIARARARSVVGIDTLEHVQRQLLGAIDDAQRIDEEARAARKAAEPKLLAMEQELISRFAPGRR